MKTRITRIGNSHGIRIPKLYLKQTALAEEVELDVQGKEIVIRSARHPRQGWDEAFREIAKHEMIASLMQERRTSLAGTRLNDGGN